MSRIFTEEELKELGTLTIDKLKAAADKGDAEAVKSLADKMYSQLAFLHDGYMCWAAALLTWIYENYGIEALGEAELFAHTLEAKVAFPPPPKDISIKEAVERHCDALMGHVYQPITVTEDDEKVVVAVTPCGSGGRLIQKGAYEKGYATIKEKCPTTWGLGDLPIYCCHCPVMEIMRCDAGEISRFVQYDGDSGKSIGPDCESVFYKNKADVPEEYFKRIGKDRPNTI